MPAPSLGFDQDEYEKRTALLQAYMARTDVAAALFTTEAELRYFTGFRTLFWQSPTRPWFLFIPQNGKPIAVIPEIGAALMRQTWIDDIRTWSAPTPTDDGISLLVELMAPLAQTRKKLGLLKGHETFLRMPLGDYERLIDLLAGLEVCDITPQIRAQRMVKSSSEIEKIAHICTIASDSFAAMGRLAFVDQGFDDTFRAFRKECLTQGADDVPYLVGGADQDVAPGGRRVVALAPLEPGGDAGAVVLEAGQLVAGVHVGAADPLDHRLVQHGLQLAAVDRELRKLVAGVEAAQVAPHLLAEAVGVDQLVGSDADPVERLE